MAIEAAGNTLHFSSIESRFDAAVVSSLSRVKLTFNRKRNTTAAPDLHDGYLVRELILM